MAIGLALAFDDEVAEKLEVEVALAGLAGFELVDAPTLEGGGTACGAAAAGLEEEEAAAAAAAEVAAAEEEPAEPIRSRAKASRARRDGWRCTAVAAVAWLAVVVVVVVAGPVGSCESHGPRGRGFSQCVSRTAESGEGLTSLAVLMQASPSESLRGSGLVKLIDASSWFCRCVVGGLTRGERSGRWGSRSSSSFAPLRPRLDGRLMGGELRLDQIDLFRPADRPRSVEARVSE